jgi:DNA-binding winged helix-turn-helix (wHTH) protein/tetratricopeptide (TPR) repeat protein
MSSKRDNSVYQFGPFLLEAGEFRLLRDGCPVPLKPKIFHLLLTLVRNSGHILTKDQLMSQIWPDSFVEEHNLAVNIFALRRALQEDSQCTYIETIPRRGYRFVAAVTRSENHSAEEVESNEPESVPDRKAAFGLEIQSLAVLPFKVIAGGASTEYLGMGIADALITRLSNLSQIIVRPTSAVRNHEEVQDSVLAGRELKVTAVLDGSVQRSGKQLRVTVQLINVESGATLWAEKFDETFSNILSMEDSISAQVADALMLKLTRRERRRLAKRYTGNTQAYQAYMRARFLWEKRTVDALNSSKKYFEQAIELDPGYALAYAGLARSYLSYTYLLLPPKVSLAKAKDLILKALKIDGGLAEAHAILGYVRLICDWDWSSAEREFSLALEINPHSAEACQLYSYYLKLTNRFDEAILEIRRAREIDPTSLRINTSVGATFYFARQYDEAIREIEKALELDPDYGPAHFFLGLAYEQEKDFERALAAYRRANDLFGKTHPEMLANLGRAYALAGQTLPAREVLDQLLALSKVSYVSPYYIAYVYLGLGDKNQVFDCLEKCFESRDLELISLKVDPILDPLRSDARFINLLGRTGFMV